MTTFSGIPLPARAQTIIEDASAGALNEVRATVFVGTRIAFDTRTHEWNLVTAIESHAAEGDHCAAYDKADRYGTANIWGRCIEAQDTTGRGALWGLEVDVMTQPDGGRGDRYGIGVVLGRNPHSPGPAFIDWGVRILPWAFDRTAVQCGTGVDITVPCRDAAIAILPGDCIALDGPRGEVKVRFNAQTGFIEALFRGNPTGEFHIATGELRILGKTVFKP